ncbi:MAG: FG-GAP-like repeat-containing protein [Trichodesmium sp. ALOHA_ZT_67]|nr:FG-GAP-like repeat-containing protein [Trichodesmium sp. ALOHA_ZT_67]
MTQPTPQDQYMLELVNRSRADPQAEADLYLDGNLNEGLSEGQISSDAKQPLAFNLNLNTAAKGHSQWMLDNNIFSHTGANGNKSGDRMRDSGYIFTGAYGSGENIAWRGTTGTPNFTTFVEKNHEGLVRSKSHRLNLMRSNLQEVGISSLQGEFTFEGINYNTVMTTQNFAYSGASGPFITGVAYTDAVKDDNFYTVGEGISGIIVTAVNTNNSNNIFTTTTWDAGGYSLDVDPNQTYDVTFSGDLNGDGQAGDTVTYQVKVSSENVKLDVVSDSLPTPNAPPIAVNDTTNTSKGQAVTFSITENDSDTDGTLELATVDLDPSTAGRQNTLTVANEGTYTVDNAGNLTFTPEPEFAGTTATITYTVEDNNGEVSNPAEIGVTVIPFDPLDQPVKFDFNGDGVADILWRRENGPNRIWLMNDNGTRKSTKNPGNFGSAWDVAGVGDFNADGVADIFWRHNKNRGNRVWLMNDNGTRKSTKNPGNFGAAWDVVGVGDFNADGVDDILWRRDNQKLNRIWLMNNNGKRKQLVNPGNFGSAWDVAGVADFNADGVDDILWRHNNGRNRISFMNNDGKLDNTVNPGGLGSTWDVAGVADFNADGVDDILWRKKNGTNSIWLMNGDGTHDDIINPGSFGSAWDVAGVADFNADGLTDILWRHDNGANRIWLMDDDSTRAQNLNPGAFGSAWDIVGM